MKKKKCIIPQHDIITITTNFLYLYPSMKKVHEYWQSSWNNYFQRKLYQIILTYLFISFPWIINKWFIFTFIFYGTEFSPSFLLIQIFWWYNWYWFPCVHRDLRICIDKVITNNKSNYLLKNILNFSPEFHVR